MLAYFYACVFPTICSNVVIQPNMEIESMTQFSCDRVNYSDWLWLTVKSLVSKEIVDFVRISIN